MTDHIPNDLSHLSEEEFNALCPQGEHAPGPEFLSPAAQAAWTAYETADCDPYLVDPRKAGLAAALRTVALHLSDTSPWPGHIESTGVNWSSNELSAIADELERQ